MTAPGAETGKKTVEEKGALSFSNKNNQINSNGLFRDVVESPPLEVFKEGWEWHSMVWLTRWCLGLDDLRGLFPPK